MPAAKTSASSVAKQFHQVLLVTTLIAIASLNSWAQNIAVSPASEAFAKTFVGVTSSAKVVTITNGGASAQPVNFVMSGDFSETDNCSGSIAAGKSCQASIFFTPTLVGSISGAAGIYDNSNNLLAFVGLSGSSAAPVTISPASLSFTPGTIGTQSAPQTITINNSTSNPVDVTGITTNVPAYQIDTGSCLTMPLVPTGICTINVQVTPTAAANDGAIIITNDAPGAVPLVVKLTSSATAVANPISLSKTSLTFKTASGGTSATQTITVTNTSSAAVQLGTIAATTDYSISGDTCTGTLLAAKGGTGTTCTFKIEFQPTFVGTIEGTTAVPFTTSNNNSPLVVNLTGTSVAPLTFAPTKLSFTTQLAGTTSAAQAVTITNNSASAVTLNIASTADFPIQTSGTTCPLSGGNLAAGGNCIVEVQFAPTVGGSIVGGLTVLNNASPSPLLIPLAGVAQGFTLTAAPSTVSMAQGLSKTSTITVHPTNGFAGSVSLVVTSLLPSGVTASFNPTSTSTTSVLTLTASSTATAGGPVAVAVTGTSGGVSQTTIINLTVTATKNFSLSAAPNNLSIIQGGSGGTSTITVTPISGFTGSVALSVISTLPSGVTATFSPTSTKTTSTLTLTAGPSATTGPATVTVQGTSGTLTQTANISLTVNPPQSFTLSASPNTLSVAQGSSNTSTITVTNLGGFTGNVTLAASGLPSGVTAGFGTNPTTGTSLLTLTANASATIGGPTTVTITGTSGALIETTTINVTVTPTPNFTLSTSPNTLSIAQGANGTSTITVNPTNGFTGSVTLVASGLPSGVTAGFGTNPTTGSSLLTLTASASATLGGPTTVTITGTSGTLSPETTTISLTVTPQPNFTLSTSPNTLSIAQGANGTSTITVNPTNGFTGGVTLAASGLPSGVTAGFGTNPTTGTSLLTLTASASATTGGPTTVTITGTSGTLSPETTTISLTVTPPANFTLSTSPNTLSIAQGANGTSTITVNPTNGFTGSVTLAASGLPSGVTAGFGTNPTTGTSLLTLTASASATTGGPTTVTITGTSGTLSPETTTISLTVVASGPSAVLNPASAHLGTSQTLLITGSGTTFGPTTTISFGSNSGVTQGTITVNGPTSMSVPITIGNNNGSGARTVTITTGSQVVTTTFTVLAGVPTVTLINPNPITPSESETVSITGAFTHWVSGTTKANFGPGIKVGGAAANTFGPVTVNNATTLTASLVSSGAALGPRTVQIQTGTQTLTVTNGMFVENCGATPTVVQMTPANNSTTALLNSSIQVQFSMPMSPANFALGTNGPIFLDDAINPTVEVPATISLDASNTILTITPKQALTANDTYSLDLSYLVSKPYVYLQDACGNNLPPQQFTFNTAFSLETTGPTLTGTSPVSGDTNIPISGASSSPTPVVLQFNIPIDPITAQLGFSMVNGVNEVLGNFTYSVDDRTVIFTPATPLAASTSYTVNYSAQITDTGGNPLNNPGSFTFTTGSATDTTAPSVTHVDPPNGTFGVGLNVTPRLTFSEPVDGATLPSTLSLVYADTGVIVPATVTVLANRLTATLTPSAPLLTNTNYNVSLPGSTYTDLAGNPGSGSSTFFYTGASAYTTALTVATINPSNGQTGVPLNARIIAVMSNNVDPTAVTNGSITVTPSGGSAIGGTVTLANDGVTLTFTPSAALTASTVYNVSVSGFTDIDGNAVTAFASSFTTGTSPYSGGSFTVVSTSPSSGATNVSVTSPVTFTMSNLINAASVNSNTVYVYANSTSQVVAGTYNVSGAAVTFNPLASTPYPANTLMGMCVSGLTDEAGNADSQCYNFTTGGPADTTPPTVTITPANGATNVGLNTQVVLAFSKSINPSTINANTVVLFNGDTVLHYGYSVSRDNRTVVLNPAGTAFMAGATITVELSNGIQDLSGNALANTSSQFTLTTSLSNSAPSVLEMRPVNGAADVPANTVVTLFTSAPMNPSSIAGALHVADNGVVVTGTLQLFGNAQAIEFTPSVPFNPADTISVSLDSTALSANNVPLSAFSGQFTVADVIGDAVQFNPFPGATNVPLNTTIQMEFDVALDPTTVTSSNVSLTQDGTAVSPTISLVGTQVVNIAPAGNLNPGSIYAACVNGRVAGTNGKKVNGYCLDFTAGTSTDNAAPTIVSLAPSNNSTNIGTNASLSLTFNKTINPVSVNGSTVQLSANSTTLPTSISFPATTSGAFDGSPDYTRVTITPQAPLPPGTQITVAINGVTSEAGKSVATTTTHFTTQAQPDYTSPYVVNASVQNGQTNVPVNSVLSMQFSKAMDAGSIDVANVGVSTSCDPENGPGLAIPATVSWSADQTTISIVPSSPLAVGSQYYMFSYSMTDLAGNPQQDFSCTSGGFTTSFSANSTPPTVVNTSPENNETQVPVNAPVQVLFSEPVNTTTIGQITLQRGGNAVPVTPTFSDANQLLTLTPAVTLSANASYTLQISGVQNTAGNQMTGTVTNTFTTGPTFNLINPSVTATDPPAGASGVGTNVAPRIVFNERLNPLSVVTSSNELYNRGSVELYNNATSQYVPATVSMSADRLTAIITPSSALQPNTSYRIYVGPSGANYYDVAGNAGTSYSGGFVTGSGSDTTPAAVSTISPANTQTGVPLNPQIIAVMNDQIDPTKVTNSSITVTPSGGSAIAGTVTLANDGVTLTFTPGAALTPSTLYNVSVGGFNDVEGNSVTPFTSSFTTGTSSFGGGSFTVLSTSPSSGATNVSVTSPVTFTMSNLIDTASVNPNTVYVYANSTNQVVAGTYSASGASVTFTPLASTPYPANTLMGMCVNGLTDEAGNADSQCYNFTTGSPADTTPPTVTITPANGTAYAGLNTQVVLTFSKSINPATINASSVNLLNGDVPINPTTSISRDNRTVILNYTSSTLPAGATITVTATHLITDLSGNALADTTSQFTTTSAVLSSAPTVISMRPGNGATVVPANTVITLFTSTPMNIGSLSGALHVSQNGVLVSGTTSISGNGQSIEFTPNSAFTAGASIQVFLDSTAQDAYGNYLQSFSGAFTIAGSLANTAAVEQATNPFPNATNVPLNTIIQIEYTQPLNFNSINFVSVTLCPTSGTCLTPTLSLSGNGQVINIAPTSSLAAGTAYYTQVRGIVTNTDGLPVHPFQLSFVTGSATDTVAPNILTVAPPDSSTNIGINAGVSVDFSKAVNPVSVTGSSIQLSGGAVTEVPSSISFTPDFARTIIVPQAPLPSSTLMAIAINNVTSVAGTAVGGQTTHFTTMAGPDFIVPYVVNPSVQNGQTVGDNAAFAMQFNKTIDMGSIDGAVVGVSSTACYAAPVPATISWSTDQTTIFVAPTSPLTDGTTYYLYSQNLMDLSGNSQTNFCVTFATEVGSDTTGPVVLQVSPPSGFTGVPINAPVQILFNEPISGVSLAGVTLQQGATVIPTTVSLYDGDQGIQLLPLVPLATGTIYTINVTGVVDNTGNPQSSFPSQSFTTGTGTGLVTPTVVPPTNPTNGQTGVPANTAVQVVFSEAMDPASFDPNNNSFTLKDSSNNVVPASVTFSPDYKTATLQPTSNLTGGGKTYKMYIGSNITTPLQDLGGNPAASTSFSFTTQ